MPLCRPSRPERTGPAGVQCPPGDTDEIDDAGCHGVAAGRQRRVRAGAGAANVVGHVAQGRARDRRQHGHRSQDHRAARRRRSLRLCRRAQAAGPRGAGQDPQRPGDQARCHQRQRHRRGRGDHHEGRTWPVRHRQQRRCRCPWHLLGHHRGGHAVRDEHQRLRALAHQQGVCAAGHRRARAASSRSGRSRASSRARRWASTA